MNWTYRIDQEITQVPEIVDGPYKAQIEKVERVEKAETTNDFDNPIKIRSTIIIHWKIIDPIEYEGEIILDRFYIDHENKKTKEIAIFSFKELCKQIKEIPIGEDLTENSISSFLIGKEAMITLKNETSNKYGNDKIFTNVKRREIIEETSPLFPQDTGISLPQKPQTTGETLNDDIPF